MLGPVLFHIIISNLLWLPLHKKWTFPLSISSVNVTKSANQILNGKHFCVQCPEKTDLYNYADSTISYCCKLISGPIRFMKDLIKSFFFCHFTVTTKQNIIECTKFQALNISRKKSLDVSFDLNDNWISKLSNYVKAFRYLSGKI